MKKLLYTSLILALQLPLTDRLFAQLTNPTPPVLLSMRVPDDAVDVSAAENLVYIEARFSSTEDLTAIQGSFVSPDGTDSFTFSDSRFTLAYHLTGNHREGTLRIPVTIPSRIASGTWNGSISLQSSSRSSRYGGVGGKVFPEGSQASLKIVNSATVNKPPVLTSLVFDKQIIDVTNNSQKLLITLTVTDDLGVDRLLLNVSKEGESGNFTPDSIERISGTSTEGIYQASVTLPPSITPGPYSISCGAIENGRNQFVSLAPPANGAGNTITVINTGEVDNAPPVLVAFQVNKTVVNVTDSDQTVEATITLEDTRSGLANAHLGLVGNDNNSIGGTPIINDIPPVYETGRVTRTVLLTIPRYSPAGTAHFKLSLQDGKGNFVDYGEKDSAPFLAVLPFPAGSVSSIQIENTTPPVSDPPALTSFEFTPSSMDQAGLPGLVEFRVRLKGDSAITSATAYIQVQPSGSMGTPLIMVEGSAKDGAWVGRTAFQGSPGEYFMWLQTGDQAGNKFRFGVVPNLPSSTGVNYPEGWPAPLLVRPGGQALDAFQTWRRAFPGFAGSEGTEQADPDGDGFPNAVEFLCNTDPRHSTLPGGPDPASKRLFWNPATLRIEFTPPTIEGDNAALGSGTRLRLKAWKSTSLKTGSWLPVEPVAGEGKTRFYPLDAPGTSGPAQFLRLGAGLE